MKLECNNNVLPFSNKHINSNRQSVSLSVNNVKRSESRKVSKITRNLIYRSCKGVNRREILTYSELFTMLTSYERTDGAAISHLLCGIV